MASKSDHIVNIVSAALSMTFLLLFLPRLWGLRGSCYKISAKWQELCQVVLGILLSIALFPYWVNVLAFNLERNVYFLVALFTSQLGTLGLSLLLLVEYQGSLNPSDLTSIYLIASILCDAVYLTMPLGVARQAGAFRIVAFRCFIYLIILVLENLTIRTAFEEASKEQSPEETHGVMSRVLFTWINPILYRGYSNVLVDADLPPLSEDIKPEFTRRDMIRTWSSRGEFMPRRKFSIASSYNSDRRETLCSLPYALIRCVKRQFLAAIMPRMFLTGFRYSQPILIQRSIRYVVANHGSAESSDGYWLLVSALAIYTGLAISTSVYGNCINRLELATKSALVGLIHHHTMQLPSVFYDNGEATTLMSTDADGLADIGTMVHETWAQVLEVIIGIVLLAREVGWIWPLLLFLIYLCSHMSRFVAKHLRPRQIAWNNATQSRMAATASMLSSIKAVKMLGFQYVLTNYDGELRVQELQAASKLRWIMVYYNASANALGIFSPAITLVIFAVVSKARGQSLNTESAFTIMAILSMVTHPANMVMTIVPRAVSAFAGFDRIQKFLLRPSLPVDHLTRSESDDNKFPRDPASSHLTRPGSAIHMQQVRLGGQDVVLDDINIDVASGSFCIISGTTGSGKSTLLRAILGEVMPSSGSVSLLTQRIAYCSQRPWLPSGSIKQTICGPTTMYDALSLDDESWYHKVIKACCLTHDFDSLPDGDLSEIGSRGLNLSGGQRQRVTLARAVFARCDIILLDDTFSGLDGETEQNVFDNVLGPNGLLRQLNTSVVLVSNSSQYFESADHVVVLGDNRIIDQGNWQNIKSKAKKIPKLSTRNHAEDGAVLAENYERLGAQVRAKDEAEMDLSRKTGDSTLYGYYFGFVRFGNLSMLVATAISYLFFIIVPQYWLELWTDSSGKGTTFYILGFMFLSIMSWVSTSIQAWILLIRIAPQSGSRIHQHLLKIITSAPLSYFSKTENGAILNRFSQDIQLIDKKLPSAVQTVLVRG
ncbi:hypothetical protein VTL71DRAFT_13780 [Oculimacula yallundae]|uniref:ABC transporter n=1 Tax=Oculimacula yallundae TaxID=86028 RepID=A0ABR4CLW6_9HELO